MRIQKLLDWRKLLIYSHRWLGIGVGVVFVAWCVSGVVLMYTGVPHLTAGERLMRLPPLNLSSIRVTPAEAAAMFKEPPRRLRISMHGERPVYRFNTGRVFGRWTLVYADTGTPRAADSRGTHARCHTRHGDCSKHHRPARQRLRTHNSVEYWSA